MRKTTLVTRWGGRHGRRMDIVAEHNVGEPDQLLGELHWYGEWDQEAREALVQAILQNGDPLAIPGDQSREP